MYTEFVPLTAASCICCLGLFWCLIPALTPALFKGYSRLSDGDTLHWRSRIVSILHAVILFVISVYALLHNPDLFNDPFECDSELLKMAAGISAGYIIADSITMVLYYRHLFQAFYVIHHPIGFIACYIYSTYGLLPFISAVFGLMEGAVPFLHIRWLLRNQGYLKNSLPCRINDLALAVLWFLGRICIIPVAWYELYRVIGTEVYLRLKWYLLSVFIGLILPVNVMNSYWFYVMCSKYRYWKGSINEKKAPEKNN